MRTPAILSGRGKIHFGLMRLCTSGNKFIASSTGECACLKPWFCETLKHSMAIPFCFVSAGLHPPPCGRSGQNKFLSVLVGCETPLSVEIGLPTLCALAQLVFTLSAVEWFEHAGNELPLCGYRPDLCLAQLMLTTSAA